MDEEQELLRNFEQISSPDERHRVIKFAEAIACTGDISDVVDWKRLQKAFRAIETDDGRKSVFDFAQATVRKSKH